MTYVVTDACIKCKYMDCVEVCPVDCFYEGDNMLVINPSECIDCGVCEPECPAEAILPDTESGLEQWLELNTKFSAEWPNITVKKPSPDDADEHKGEDVARPDDTGAALHPPAVDAQVARGNALLRDRAGLRQADEPQQLVEPQALPAHAPPQVESAAKTPVGGVAIGAGGRGGGGRHCQSGGAGGPRWLDANPRAARASTPAWRSSAG